MEEFWYVNPTRIEFGKGKIDHVGQIISEGEKRTVLFVFGSGSIHRNGTHSKVLKHLAAAGLRVIEHGGVRSNPLLSHARAGIALARTQGVDCVLAVGGGSVIDEAKAIAFGVLSEKDVWHYFYQGEKPTCALPIYTAVTLAASGSEMNWGTVITDEESKVKAGIAATCLSPRVSILDPALTMGVPRSYTMFGVADAFSHVMEGYFNGSGAEAPVSDRLAEGAFRSLLDAARRLDADLDAYEARADILWAACVAQNGLLNAGRGKVLYEIHCIAHCLGGLFNVPHGAAISVAIPAWADMRLPAMKPRFRRFAVEAMGVEDQGDETCVALEGLARLCAWLKLLGLPLSLAALGLGEEHVPQLVAALQVAVPRGMRGVDQEEIVQVVRRMVAGVGSILAGK